MSDAFALARSRLLDPAALAGGDLERVFTRLMGPGIDRADVYFQHSRYESWVLEDGIIKEGTFASSRAPACAPSAARRPASPIPTRSRCRRCWRPPRRRARSRAAVPRCGPQALAARRPAGAVCADRPDRDPAAGGEGGAAARGRRRGPRAGPAGQAGDRQRRRRRWTACWCSQRRRAGRRRAPAGAPQRQVIVEAERPARAGSRRRRRALSPIPGSSSRSAVRVRPRGGAPGAGQPGGSRRAGREHDRGARARLARRAAARGGRPRPGGDFNRKGTSAPSPAGSASGWPRPASPWWTTAPCRSAAVRSTSTTKARRPSAPC